MNTYQIEVTDTFGGEPNYCWVRRYTFRAKNIKGAILQLARTFASGWRFDYGDSESARYNLKGAAICAFVEWVDDAQETRESSK